MSGFDADFCALPPESQEEINDLAVVMKWSISRATEEYLSMASSLAAASRVQQNTRKAPVLRMVGRRGS